MRLPRTAMRHVYDILTLNQLNHMLVWGFILVNSNRRMRYFLTSMNALGQQGPCLSIVYIANQMDTEIPKQTKCRCSIDEPMTEMRPFRAASTTLISAILMRRCANRPWMKSTSRSDALRFYAQSPSTAVRNVISGRGNTPTQAALFVVFSEQKSRGRCESFLRTGARRKEQCAALTCQVIHSVPSTFACVHPRPHKRYCIYGIRYLGLHVGMAPFMASDEFS